MLSRAQAMEGPAERLWLWLWCPDFSYASIFLSTFGLRRFSVFLIWGFTVVLQEIPSGITRKVWIFSKPSITQVACSLCNLAASRNEFLSTWTWKGCC